VREHAVAAGVGLEMIVDSHTVAGLLSPASSASLLPSGDQRGNPCAVLGRQPRTASVLAHDVGDSVPTEESKRENAIRPFEPATFARPEVR